MKDNKLYLICAAEAIERIESYTSGGRDMFMASTLIQDAVLCNMHKLEGVALRETQELREQHSAVLWAAIADRLSGPVHNYLDTDLDITWLIVEDDLPELKRTVSQMLGDFGS
jgi:uncharacterized protein with HEPN domain